MSDATALGRIRAYNLETAELAAAGKRELLAQLLVDAATTVDPDLRRKIYETVGKEAVSQDPKTPLQISAPLNFSIVLDADVQQVAPSRRARAVTVTQEIEDAVDVSTPIGRLALFASEEVSLADLMSDE